MSSADWKLADDRKSVLLTFPTNPPTAIKFDVAGIEDALQNLGKFRALMSPEVPKTHEKNQKVEAIPDPAWVTGIEMMQGNSVLHIRDPRYGWLHYMLPRQEARKLAGFLQKQVDTPLAEPEANKTN
jgi:hypothetical protein